MKTVISVRFSQQQQEGIQRQAEDQGTTPAALIREAVDQFLENANGEGLEARISARLEALAATLPQAAAQATADEIESRRKAALAAKQARESANVQ